ncbi:phage holin [Enterococcus cecorum]|uniref:phage holin n=1 Tax=Enterococcus cecorum TaxID=44008 RepID=UPI00148CC5C6|nr:phage holin [Enterococcus cecorum]
MKINWKVRVKNKMFWLSVVPAVLLLVQAIAAPFGYKFDFGVLNQQLADIINAAFVVLTILGVVVDPTTHGVNDSTNALNYDQPKKEDD